MDFTLLGKLTGRPFPFSISMILWLCKIHSSTAYKIGNVTIIIYVIRNSYAISSRQTMAREQWQTSQHNSKWNEGSILQSNRAQGYFCWQPLFNQSSWPSCKKRVVNSISLPTPMASVYFHSYQHAKLEKKEMDGVLQYRKGSPVFQRSDKFLYS